MWNLGAGGSYRKVKGRLLERREWAVQEERERVTGREALVEYLRVHIMYIIKYMLIVFTNKSKERKPKILETVT